jgi:integrase
MHKPGKPRPDFPLFPHANGQWAKKFFLNGKHALKYFGPWSDDLKGERALLDYLARKDAILAGLDNLRVTSPGEGMTLGELVGRYLDSRRQAMLAGELSGRMYGDYLAELHRFAKSVGEGAKVAAIRPEHFSAYAGTFTTIRHLGRHSRKRVIALVKAMLNWGAGMGFYPPPTYGNDFAAPSTTAAAIRQAKAREGKPDHSGRIVTGEEVDNIVLWFKRNPQFKAIVLMGVNCGLGPADIGRLRWRHFNIDTGELNMPRGKTGTDRRGYLWKRTRKALRRVATLKHNRLALEREGQDALVFWTRSGRQMYRETEIIKGDVSVDVKADQAISITFGKCTRKLKLDGVSFYRLRHTFKTLGKKAKDRDALNLCMGHREPGIGTVYDHEEIEFARVKRVALAVKGQLWPKPKQAKKHAGNKPARPMMRMADYGVGDGELPKSA